jgi:hypothetical protein
MIYRHAKKLHNGDEVIDKATGESVRVLSIEAFPAFGIPRASIPPYVIIEGVGDKRGHRYWQHTTVR